MFTKLVDLGLYKQLKKICLNDALNPRLFHFYQGIADELRIPGESLKQGQLTSILKLGLLKYCHHDPYVHALNHSIFWS